MELAKRKYDVAFFTDGSVQKNHCSAAACVGYLPEDGFVLKKAKHACHTTLARPAGLTAVSAIPENNALNLPLFALSRQLITSPSTDSTKKRPIRDVFIGTDSQSCLVSMMQPLKRRKPFHVNTQLTLKHYRDQAVRGDQELFLSHIPSHVGLPGNNEADKVANMYAKTCSRRTQSNCDVSLSTLKSMIFRSEREKWFTAHKPADHVSARDMLVGRERRSKLRMRREMTRPLQCLYSKYRLGVAESCGRLPRYLGLLSSDSCRYCSCDHETVQHLLLECPGTKPHLDFPRVLPAPKFLLQHDTPAYISSIAQFDSWIRHNNPEEYSNAHFNLAVDKDLSMYTQKLAGTKRKASDDPVTSERSGCLKPLKDRKIRREGTRLVLFHSGQRNWFYQIQQCPP